MTELFLLSTLIIAISMAFLCVKVFARKDGKFASQHIHDSKAMKAKGIGCVLEQDREARRTAGFAVSEKGKRNSKNQEYKMKKNNFIGAVGIAALSACTLLSCNNSSPKMDEQPSAEKTGQTSGMKIAYVEVDSLMSQYKFCKEYSLILQKKSNNARNTLTQKGKQLQAAAANFQQKMQNNGFASREQAASVQAAIQRQEQDLQELQNRLGSELDAETAKYNTALRDSLRNFLTDYNKSKKYDLIISKAGDNILYADSRHDITQDVVNGLNKRYKSTVKNDK